MRLFQNSYLDRAMQDVPMLRGLRGIYSKPYTKFYVDDH